MQTLPYQGKNQSTQVTEQDSRQMHDRLKVAIVRHHFSIFSAAGYKQWLSRNFGHVASAEMDQFEGKVTGDTSDSDEVANRKLKDLVLRELIWTVAEQIRHCPQRINHLFHMFSSDKQNVNWYSMDSHDLVEFFYRHKDNITEIRKLPTPYISVKTIKQGIDGFLNCDYNFDDIDDCGKNKMEKFKKTFVEAPGFFHLFRTREVQFGLVPDENMDGSHLILFIRTHRQISTSPVG